MLPKIRRVSSILRKTNNESSASNNQLIPQSNERLSNKSSSSSSKSTEDGNNVYVETLLYIVHVDDIDLPISPTDDTAEEVYDVDNEQQLSTTNQMSRRLSKRTTASFNERHQTSKEPIYSRPSFTFANPLRRLNSLLKSDDKPTQSPSTPKLNRSPLYASTAKRSSTFLNQSCSENQGKSKDEDEQRLFPLPPPSFLYDNPITTAEQQATIEASGPGLKDGFTNDNCLFQSHFDLNAPNVELKKLVIAIDGPSKADIQIEIVDAGIYRVFYTCQTPGNYHISLTYDGHHIGDSPYHLRLRTQPLQEQVVPPALPPALISPRALIEPIEFHVNTPCIVTVRPEVPCGIFQAYIQAPQGNMNLPITVHKSAKSECYEIYFLPNICGNHLLNVSLNHVPIVDNPHRLTVRSSSSSKPIAATGQGLFHAYAGEASQFFVSKSPTDSSSGTGTFSVGISGPSTVFLDANETEHGYEFHYKPMRCGKYFITIKNGGKHIQGSPFMCRVYSKPNENRALLSTMYEIETDNVDETTIGSTTQATSSCNSLLPIQTMLNPIHSSSTSTTYVDLDILRSSMTGDASQVCVFGTGLYEAKPRRKAKFKIDASQAGFGLLLVGLYSSRGPAERLVIKRTNPSSPGYVYKVSYRVRIRGQYMLVILYGSTMQHVPGSPYLVIVE
ncbi:unnamed protein product [Adineta ricciae]|uniref:Uncharacterized protein n=1 Tax=Adineta ricciae TaxID=249248 RepID=A0A815ZEE3_ADIRI|nr:unnamed protein product [Adineta ricciae]